MKLVFGRNGCYTCQSVPKIADVAPQFCSTVLNSYAAPCFPLGLAPCVQSLPCVSVFLDSADGCPSASPSDQLYYVEDFNGPQTPLFIRSLGIQTPLADLLLQPNSSALLGQVVMIATEFRSSNGEQAFNSRKRGELQDVLTGGFYVIAALFFEASRGCWVVALKRLAIQACNQANGMPGIQPGSYFVVQSVGSNHLAQYLEQEDCEEAVLRKCGCNPSPAPPPNPCESDFDFDYIDAGDLDQPFSGIYQVASASLDCDILCANYVGPIPLPFSFDVLPPASVPDCPPDCECNVCASAQSSSDDDDDADSWAPSDDSDSDSATADDSDDSDGSNNSDDNASNSSSYDSDDSSGSYNRINSGRRHRTHKHSGDKRAEGKTRTDAAQAKAHKTHKHHKKSQSKSAPKTAQSAKHRHSHRHWDEAHIPFDL